MERFFVRLTVEDRTCRYMVTVAPDTYFHLLTSPPYLHNVLLTAGLSCSRRVPGSWWRPGTFFCYFPPNFVQSEPPALKFGRTWSIKTIRRDSGTRGMIPFNNEKYWDETPTPAPDCPAVNTILILPGCGYQLILICCDPGKHPCPWVVAIPVSF